MIPARLLFLIITLYSSLVFSQLPNKNMYVVSQLNNYPGYSGIWGYVAPDAREYAILCCINGTSIVDVTDSSNIHEIGFVPGSVSPWREAKTFSHYAYVISEATNSRLQIIDLQYLPDSISLVTTFSYPGFTQAHNISQSGPFLYLSGVNSDGGGVRILELLNPVLPNVRGINSVRYVHDCRVLNDTIWAANILNQRVSIIDAVDKDNPVEVRNFLSLQHMPHNVAISKDRKYLYVTHEEISPPGSLEVWNIEDLENITFIRNWLPSGIETSVTHNIEVFDTLAYISHYTAGVRVLNISDPSNPVEIGWYDTRPQDNSNILQGCWGVYWFPSGKIIASDISNGLFVLKLDIQTNIKSEISLAQKFSLEQNYPNPFNPVTKIKFEVDPSSLKSQSSVIKLVVYDAMGKEVQTLLNERLSPGSHEVVFDGMNLPSGIYYYKLRAGEFSETRKMILLK